MTRVQAELDETKIILVRLQGRSQMLLPAQASGGPGGMLWSRVELPQAIPQLPGVGATFSLPLFHFPPFFLLGLSLAGWTQAPEL